MRRRCCASAAMCAGISPRKARACFGAVGRDSLPVLLCCTLSLGQPLMAEPLAWALFAVTEGPIPQNT